MGFWIAAIALAALTALYVARPLALARRGARSRAAHDEQVFRDQLSEIDRDVERGVLTEAEARAARIEVSRRLLAAAAEREATPDHAPAPKFVSYALALTLLVATPLGGWALYERIGAPGLPDQPLSARSEGLRPSQAVAESRMPQPEPEAEAGPEVARLRELITELEARVAEAPDRQGLFLLAQSYTRLGRHAEAWRAFDRLIGFTGGDAPAAIFTAKAESMILAAGGYISPEAEAALSAALTRSPRDPVARYYMGAVYAQTGRPQSAMETWTGLLADSPADAPWREATVAEIRTLAERTGLPAPDLPPPAPAAVPPEMRALVERLDERLAAEGGTPAEWIQLVRSRRTLGETDAAEQAIARARADLADDADALGIFETGLAAEPAALPGPSQEDMAAAAEMAPEDRAAMIRGMVDGLRERLYADGGDPQEWARLVRALGVLGEPDAARDALDRALAAHGEDAQAVALLRDTAEAAGLGAP